MRSRLVNGMLLGGVAGALVGLYFLPRARMNGRQELLGKSRRIKLKTGRLMSNVARDIYDYVSK